jgi:hypothetical protein
MWGERGYFKLTYGVNTMNTEINIYDKLCKQQDEAREKLYKFIRLEVAHYNECANTEIEKGNPQSIALNDAIGTVHGIAVSLKIISELWDSELTNLALEVRNVHSELNEKFFNMRNCPIRLD